MEDILLSKFIINGFIDCTLSKIFDNSEVTINGNGVSTDGAFAVYKSLLEFYNLHYDNKIDIDYTLNVWLNLQDKDIIEAYNEYYN